MSNQMNGMPMNNTNGMPGLHQQPPPPHILPKASKKPHIKKPLNAFMLFMKEQRAQVVSECTLRESAAINQILGRKWHELERTEQAKYYEMARQERLKHMQLYPGWSARDNYGLKKKRRRKREKVIGENGELPRKCRARYGLHQLNLWCKPCRRKKKCCRFGGMDDGSGQMNGNGMVMGPNGQMYPNGQLYPNGAFNAGDGSSGGMGSGSSLNGGNSEDDYDDYEDDPDGIENDDDDDDEEDDDNDDVSEDDDDIMEPHKPSKIPHHESQKIPINSPNIHNSHPLGFTPHNQAHLQQGHHMPNNNIHMLMSMNKLGMEQGLLNETKHSMLQPHHPHMRFNPQDLPNI